MNSNDIEIIIESVEQLKINLVNKHNLEFFIENLELLLKNLS